MMASKMSNTDQPQPDRTQSPKPMTNEQMVATMSTLRRWTLLVMRNEASIFQTLGAMSKIYKTITGAKEVSQRMELCEKLGNLLDRHVRMLEDGKGFGVVFDDEGTGDLLRELADKDCKKKADLAVSAPTVEVPKPNKRAVITDSDEDDAPLSKRGRGGTTGQGSSTSGSGGKAGKQETAAERKKREDKEAMQGVGAKQIGAPESAWAKKKRLEAEKMGKGTLPAKDGETVAARKKRLEKETADKVAAQESSAEASKDKVFSGDSFAFKSKVMHDEGNIRAVLIEEGRSKGGCILYLDAPIIDMKEEWLKAANTDANLVESAEDRIEDHEIMGEFMSRFMSAIMRQFVMKLKARPLLFAGVWDHAFESKEAKTFSEHQSNLCGQLMRQAAFHGGLMNVKEEEFRVRAMQSCLRHFKNVIAAYKVRVNQPPTPKQKINFEIPDF